jgi:hypothetical protein
VGIRQSRCEDNVFRRDGPAAAADLFVRLHQPSSSAGTGGRHSDTELGQRCAEGQPVTKNGTLIELDDQNRAKSYLDFTDAAIADFGVPGFDGASNNAITYTLEASIRKSTFRPGDSSPVQLPNRPKPFLASNFRLKIDGLPTTRVRLIAPFSFRHTDRGIVPTDLVVTFANLDVDPWRAWADDFIVKGNNGQDKEKQGAIEVMAPNLADVLATLTIKQIGIVELIPTDGTSAGSHRASMYFEYGQLSIP